MSLLLLFFCFFNFLIFRLVVRTLYYVKVTELGHSHFMGWQACGMWAELNISGWIRAHLLYCLAFYFLTTTALTTVAKISQWCT